MPVSPQNTIHTRNPLQCQQSDETSNQQQQQQSQSNSTSYSNNNNNPNYKEYKKLFFLNSESNASQIIDNTRVRSLFVLLFCYLKFLLQDYKTGIIEI